MRSDITLTGLVNKIISEILNPVIALLFGIALLTVLWGIVQYVVGAQGNEGKLKTGKSVIIYGILGMVIMASAWGLVRMVCNFFGTCNGGAVNINTPSLSPGGSSSPNSGSSGNFPCDLGGLNTNC